MGIFKTDFSGKCFWKLVELPFCRSLAAEVLRNIIAHDQWSQISLNFAILELAESLQKVEYPSALYLLNKKQPALHKKWSFPLRISLVNVTISENANLVTFTEENLNGKLLIFCSIYTAEHHGSRSRRITTRQLRSFMGKSILYINGKLTKKRCTESSTSPTSYT